MKHAFMGKMKELKIFEFLLSVQVMGQELGSGNNTKATILWFSQDFWHWCQK